MDNQIQQLNEQATASARAGELDIAEQLWNTALRLDPHNPVLLTNLCRLLFQLNRDEEIINYLTSSIASTGLKLSPPALMLLGQSALRLRQYAIALRSLKKVDALRPNDPMINLALSQAFIGTGRLNESISLLERLVAQFPNEIEPRLNLAIAFSEAGLLDDATTLYQTLLNSHPNNIQIFLNACRFFLHIGDVKQAESILNVSRWSSDRSSTVLQLKAEILVALNDHESAFNVRNQLLRLDPSDLDSCLFCFYHLLESRRLIEAKNLIEDFARLVPESLQSTRFLTALYELPSGVLSENLARHIFSLQRSIFTSKLLQANDPFLKELIATIHQEATLLDNRPGKPTRQGLQTHEILQRDEPWCLRLQELIRAAVSDYLATENDLPFFSNIIKNGVRHISGWAVVLNSHGKQIRHTHPDAIVSGVLYLQIPEFDSIMDRSGQLLFTSSPVIEPQKILFSVQPEEGMLALFPSYLPHETAPFVSNKQRICISFNCY